MIILGVDPGYGILGYGALKVEGNRFHYLTHGVITTPKGLEMHKRLLMLKEEFLKVIETFKPDEVALEELFFFKNVKTALKVGEARGVILLILAERNIDVKEYTPYQVKKAVTGDGRAKKEQVQFMMKTLLNLKDVPKPDDAADALALAWCHAVYRKSGGTWFDKDKRY